VDFLENTAAATTLWEQNAIVGVDNLGICDTEADSFLD